LRHWSGALPAMSSSHLSHLPRPILRAQDLLVDLADGGEWQGVDELDLLGRVRAACRRPISSRVAR
jgi:hypothetical protein